MTEPDVEAVDAKKEDERARRTEHRPGGRRRGLLAPALANLAIGLPAIIPLYLTYWLLTDYLPSNCDAFAADPALSNCDYHTLEDAPLLMFLLAVTGALLLMVLVMVNVLAPRSREDDNPRRWLAMTTLIPVPFLVLLCLAKA
ncbi:hypothetical protein [Streptomyces regalis]|uniref:hypothetical protein n=1 Tax=Streptomyces regalis TaxID=68262 RepID=UPI00131D4F7A|nr:hypothetical protein [Streptomyces regalis]